MYEECEEYADTDLRPCQIVAVAGRSWRLAIWPTNSFPKTSRLCTRCPSCFARSPSIRRRSSESDRGPAARVRALRDHREERASRRLPGPRLRDRSLPRRSLPSPSTGFEEGGDASRERCLHHGYDDDRGTVIEIAAARPARTRDVRRDRPLRRVAPARVRRERAAVGNDEPRRVAGSAPSSVP